MRVLSERNNGGRAEAVDKTCVHTVKREEVTSGTQSSKGEKVLSVIKLAVDLAGAVLDVLDKHKPDSGDGR